MYVKPSITITVKDEFIHIDRIYSNKGKFITVIGQAGRPGPQIYRPKLCLLDVVLAANPTEFAAINRVELLRHGKAYKYNMSIKEQAEVKVYPDDQVVLPVKAWIGM